MWYTNETDLTQILLNFNSELEQKKDWNAYSEYTPEKVMNIFKKVYLVNEERTKLVLVGCISLILLQAMIHIGVNIRLFPTTGMTLPFISYGGSSIISISILSGIILNLTKRQIN